MTCTQVENLLPLYAGGDAGAEAGRAIAAHLASCDACRALADEWAESQTLLRSHEPPRFDAAFFDSVRQGVMQKIERAPRMRPPLVSVFAQLFRPRALAFASALALLLFAGALALRLSRGGASVHAPSGDLAITNTGPDRAKPPNAPDAASTDERREQTQAAKREPSAARHTQRRRTAAASRPRKPSPGYEVAHTRRRGANRDAASPAAPPNETASANPPAPERGAQADATQGRTEVAALDDDALADRKMLRIEMQTADPNVRIIWLSPQAGDAPKK